MNEEDVQLVKRLIREEFWELLDSEVLPVLRDFIGIKADVFSRSPIPLAESPKSLLPESMFDVLTWQGEKGAKLGDFETAYKSLNQVDKWQHCFNILSSNNATIKDSFHPEGYTHRYWIYPDKYDDRIFRKKLEVKT